MKTYTVEWWDRRGEYHLLERGISRIWADALRLRLEDHDEPSRIRLSDSDGNIVHEITRRPSGKPQWFGTTEIQ